MNHPAPTSFAFALPADWLQEVQALAQTLLPPEDPFVQALTAQVNGWDDLDVQGPDGSGRAVLDDAPPPTRARSAEAAVP